MPKKNPGGVGAGPQSLTHKSPFYLPKKKSLFCVLVRHREE